MWMQQPCAAIASPSIHSISLVPTPFDAANPILCYACASMPGHQLSICAEKWPTELQRGLHPSSNLVGKGDRFGDVQSR